MKATFLITLVTATLTFNAKAQGFNFLWAKSIGSSSMDYAKSITKDTSGNSYTTGFFQGTVDFDPGAGTYNLTSNGLGDIFVVKLNSSGAFVWVKTFGDVGTDDALSIVLDPSGNIYFSGQFSNTVDFDPGAGVSNLAAAGAYDGFICKLDGGGNFVWAKRMGGPSSGTTCNSIAVDPTGNIYITGNFGDTIDADPGAPVYTLTSPGGEEMFVSKLDPAGNFLWGYSAGSLNQDSGSSIKIDGAGNILATGYFSGTVDFDPGAAVYNLTSSGTKDVFVCKLNPLGNLMWAKNMGGSNIDQANSLAIDGAGNVYTTGNFAGTADFDPGASAYNLSSAGMVNPDIFVSKLDSLGNFVWAKNIGDTYADYGTAITIDGSGNVYFTGRFHGNGDFDPGAATYNLSSSGGPSQPDVFVAKLNALGDFIWAQRMGETGFDSGQSIVIDNVGGILIAGVYNGTVDFDPGAPVYNLTFAGYYDIFILKLHITSNVWPGDADNNLVVDNTDILPIGLFFLQMMGPLRIVTGNIWQSDLASDWGILEPSGVDIKNADCNGDGFIDYNDTLAINLNYSLTHTFAPTLNDERSTNPALYFATTSATYPPGSWINVDIMAGTSTFPVDNLYGIAFDLLYDASLVQPGTESLIYPNSWFANPGTDAIKIGKINAIGSTAFAAETRIDHVNKDGYGKIATFRFQTKSTISSLSTMNFSFSGYMANDSVGVPVVFNLQPYSVVVDPLAAGITDAENPYLLGIFPNPSDGNFNVSFNVVDKGTYKLELINGLGQMIYKEELKDFSGTYNKQLSVIEYGKGVYTITLSNDKNEVVKKIIVY